MRINKQRILNEFLELVQIDSATGEERLMADALKHKLEVIGFTVTEDKAGDAIKGNAGNLIAKLKGTTDAPTLLFCAHMDRVTPGKQIKPQIDNGVIRSDGTTILAADDVAGLVAILEGVRAIKEQNIPHGDLEVVFTIAEEGGLNGAKGLDATNLEAKMGYFLDAGGPVGTIVTNAPAQKGLNIVIHGKAAHAGVNPEAGISAIVVAAHAITKMKLGRIDQETTANIGVIHGGTATNIVTDRVELKGEARSRHPQKLEDQIAHMLQVVQETAAEFHVTTDIKVKDSYTSFNLTASDPVVELAIKAAQSLGLKPTLESTGGGSDANIINGYGIPSIVLGMGYAEVHTTNESMPISQLEKSAEYVVALIEHA